MENGTGQMRLVEEPVKPLAMHPKKFAMWLFLASVTMLFAVLTSAYVVRRADGNWFTFELPSMFMVTSVVIFLSSVSLHIAYLWAKKGSPLKVKTWVSVTAILGVLFMVGQLVGWQQMVNSQVHFSGGNPSASFVYVLSGLHGVHLISAVIFLVIVWNSARAMKICSKNLAQIEMCTTYWHFLGGLWLYLFVFLTYFR